MDDFVWQIRGVNEEKGESDRGKVSDIKDGLSRAKGQGNCEDEMER